MNNPLLAAVFAVYQRLLKHPVRILIVMMLVMLVATYHIKDFSFDASSDTLVAKNDPALKYYREVRERFTTGGESFLFLTYTPKEGELIAKDNLEYIARLQTKLESIQGVASVYSILDAPLLKSPPVELKDIRKDGYKTLASENVDFDLAKQELSTSPIFRGLLISDDANTTALRIGLNIDQKLEQLRKKRDESRLAFKNGEMSKAELEAITSAHVVERQQYLVQRDLLLEEVRQVRDQARQHANIFLGGVPMVAADMIQYVKQDMVIFSAMILLVVIVMLFLFFRSWRWVVLPLVTATMTILIVMGWLGAIEKPATVISSNFISLLAILTISFTVHLIVRYRELLLSRSDFTQERLVLKTMGDKFFPSLYTGLTTIVAFASLIFTDIVPVQDFGLLMCVGVLVSLSMVYLLFPSILLLLPKKPSKTLGQSPQITLVFSRLVTQHYQNILLFSMLTIVVAGIGISKLSLDNRFIDYFKPETEIRQGMLDIDRNLGGTVPFDVVVKFPPYTPMSAEEAAEDDFFDGEADAYPERYWVTPDKLEVIRKLQAYIQSIEQTGKVMSLANLEQVAMDFTDGEPLKAPEIAALLGFLPDEVRKQLVDPYIFPTSGEMRISVRVRESCDYFSREDYLNRIKQFAVTELGLDADAVQITGMLVLFNNMLVHLFDSQLKTILYVVGLIFLMILVSIRSMKLAVIGLLPNVLAASSVLAIMGFLVIPLDLMTITIAAIVIGIGVDNAIHYLHRFKIECKTTDDVREAVRNSHNSIGSAIYFTSFTIIAGFSILIFSNFMPTVYFGVFTSLAMLLALMANLLILPSLLMLFYRK